MSLFAAAAVVFALFVASFSQRSTWLALCSIPMSMALVFGCLLLSTIPDRGQVRIWFAWAASNVPVVFNLQIVDDIASTFEYLAAPPRCDWKVCNAATSAAFLSTKDAAKQPTAAAGLTGHAIDDRDYLIRTIAFEASGEPEMAKIAVAYVILNRKQRGRWGDNIKAVVTHPGQFEPWETKRKEIEELSLDDPRYQSAAIIADAVLSGQTPDPTAGATYFLNPTIVRERRDGALPPWARGAGLSIGSHTFYYEEDSPSSRRAGLTMLNPHSK